MTNYFRFSTLSFVQPVIKIGVFVILFLGMVLPAQAFSKVGHQLVCAIAYQELSDVNQKKVDTLLNQIPAEHKKLINKYAGEKQRWQFKQAWDL